jgi:hypothetical protein
MSERCSRLILASSWKKSGKKVEGKRKERKEEKRSERGGKGREEGGYKKVLLVRNMGNVREDERKRWKEGGRRKRSIGNRKDGRSRKWNEME